MNFYSNTYAVNAFEATKNVDARTGHNITAEQLQHISNVFLCSPFIDDDFTVKYIQPRLSYTNLL